MGAEGESIAGECAFATQTAQLSMTLLWSGLCRWLLRARGSNKTIATQTALTCCKARCPGRIIKRRITTAPFHCQVELQQGRALHAHCTYNLNGIPQTIPRRVTGALMGAPIPAISSASEAWQIRSIVSHQ